MVVTTRPHPHTYSVVVTWRDVISSCGIHLTLAQAIEALAQINQMLDERHMQAGQDIRVLVLEESDTRH
jgi:hypothetical protein